MMPRPIVLIALAALLAGLYSLTLARSVTWANLASDSGDLITAAAVGGVPHPTGYPLYSSLAGWFLKLPMGNPALRLSVLSMASALVAVLLLARVLRSLPVGPVWLAAAAFGVSPLVWSLAVVPEVYALNLAFWALAVWLTLRAWDDALTPGWPEVTGAFALGLGMGNHLTLGLIVLVWLSVILRRGRRRRGERVLRWQWAAFAAGLLIYLAIPIRASTHPAVNWGRAVHLSGLLWIASGRLYMGFFFAGFPAVIQSRLLSYAQALFHAFGPVGLILSAVGAAQWRRRDGLWQAAAWSFGLYSLFSLLYSAQDFQAFLLPAIGGMAIWLGKGVEAVAAWTEMRVKAGRPLTLTLAALALGLPAVWTYPQVDASQATGAAQFAQSVVVLAPRDALVLTGDDADTFSLWYTHYAEGRRPDLRVVNGPLLDYGWYRAGLADTYPDLAIPARADPGWTQALRAGNSNRPYCETWADAERGTVHLHCE